MNPINYPALQHLAFEPQSGDYYATGTPVRLVAECSIDLGERRMITAPVKAAQHGEFLTYKIELSTEDGTLHYLADAYFANGLLDDAELKRYQKELRAFSVLIQRVAVVD